MKLRAPIDHASAWRRADFSSPSSFTMTPDAIQLAELDACCSRLEKGGRSIDATTREDFALPGWQQMFQDAREQLKSGRGFVLLKGLPFAD